MQGWSKPCIHRVKLALCFIGFDDHVFIGFEDKHYFLDCVYYYSAFFIHTHEHPFLQSLDGFLLFLMLLFNCLFGCVKEWVVVHFGFVLLICFLENFKLVWLALLFHPITETHVCNRWAFMMVFNYFKRLWSIQGIKEYNLSSFIAKKYVFRLDWVDSDARNWVIGELFALLNEFRIKLLRFETEHPDFSSCGPKKNQVLSQCDSCYLNIVELSLHLQFLSYFSLVFFVCYYMLLDQHVLSLKFKQWVFLQVVLSIALVPSLVLVDKLYQVYRVLSQFTVIWLCDTLVSVFLSWSVIEIHLVVEFLQEICCFFRVLT